MLKISKQIGQITPPPNGFHRRRLGTPATMEKVGELVEVRGR